MADDMTPEGSDDGDTNNLSLVKTEEPPPRPRLNPKLTGRGRGAPPPTYMSRYDEGKVLPEAEPDEDDEDFFLKTVKPKNPRLDMIHTGKWVKKAFELGRYIPRTGCWTCCGDQEHLSMYCESKLARRIWQEGIDAEEAEEANRLRYKKEQEKRIKGLYDDGVIGNSDAHKGNPTEIEVAIEMANAEESHFNAPMLVSWVYKHLDEELTTTQGLNYIRKQTETGEGCELMLKNGIVDCVMAAAEAWRLRPDLVLLCASTIRRLLDCNFTRPALLDDIALLRKSFGFGHTFMTSVAHVEEACQSVMQFSRGERARVDILARRVPVYLQNMCRRFSQAPAVVRPVLKTFIWVANSDKRMKVLVDWGAIVTTIKCMQRHITNPRILAPAIHFLTRACAMYPRAAKIMIENEAISSVISAMKALANNEVLQIEGLKMLQMLSRSKKGWDQISATRGGWQSICQGTTAGNALIHDLPGAFNNPGWAIGETPHLPILDRAKQQAARLEAARTREPARSEWTVKGLQEFMGLPTKEMKLAINNERHESFFSLMTTLGLLPMPGEEREYWFMRTKRWETENMSSLEDMTDTLLALRKKAVKREEPVESDEHIKPVYFMGEKYNSVALVEGDTDLMEELDDILHEK